MPTLKKTNPKIKTKKNDATVPGDALVQKYFGTLYPEPAEIAIAEARLRYYRNHKMTEKVQEITEILRTTARLSDNAGEKSKS